MHWSSPAALWLAAAVALVLLCSSCCEAGRLEFEFRTPGSVKARLGLSRLARIQKRSSQTFKSIDELAHEIERDPDLGVDLDHDRLLYACSGLEVTPEVEAAVTAAQATWVTDAPVEAPPATDPLAAVTPVAMPLLEPSTVDPAAVAAAAASAPVDDPAAAAEAEEEAAAGQDAAPGDHHHHHHRHLLQGSTATKEWASPWPFLPEVADTVITPTLTRAQAFSLHSRPGATRKIFLDFDGFANSGSAWGHYNKSYQGPLVTPPYDTDGNPSAFSASELVNILGIWRGVAEDYAPFDVDITTEEPVGAPLNTWSRVAIGGNCYDWFINETAKTGGAGGVAHVGVWGRNDHFYQPAYVFPANLGNGAVKYVSEAISHEVGHNLALNHDGTTSNAYYSGHDTAVAGLSWAPIMGVGYYKKLTQWSKGEYPGANNQQDDLAIIATKLPYIAQEHSISQGSPTPLLATLNAGGLTATANVTGVISKSDSEVFTFRAGPGTVDVQVMGMPSTGTFQRSNLYLNLTITDSTRKVVDTVTSAGGIVKRSPVLNGGTFTLSLQPDGLGNPATNGFSNYASRGQYQMLLTYPVSTTPDPPPPQKYLQVKSLTGSKTKSGTKYTCTYTVFIQDDTSLAVVSGATVTGYFTTTKGYTGWPISKSGLTDATGTVKLVSPAVPTAKGYDCNIQLTDMNKPSAGFVMKPGQASTKLNLRVGPW